MSAMTTSRIALAAAGVGLTAVVLAQTPQPQPEIYLAKLSPDGVRLTVGAPVNISQNADYDNQPAFLPDGSGILFSSKRDGTQNDIYRYDVKRRQVTQVTKTPESEYSPLMTPDKKTFSVIRVEADKSQRLWRFNLDGSSPQLILERVKPVGYHAWIDATHLALFILGDAGSPNTLQVADTKTGEATVIESSIGRSLLVRPGRATISFVHKPQTGAWVVKELDPKTRATSVLVPTPDRSEDCAWLPDGRLVMAQGTKLLTWRAGDERFIEGADLSAAGLAQMTRLAVSPDGRWMALVAIARPPGIQ
jgi:dipeptidyl aminopeptidase/acylaminoacyl peptidase